MSSLYNSVNTALISTMFSNKIIILVLLCISVASAFFSLSSLPNARALTLYAKAKTEEAAAPAKKAPAVKKTTSVEEKKEVMFLNKNSNGFFFLFCLFFLGFYSFHLFCKTIIPNNQCESTLSTTA